MTERQTNSLLCLIAAGVLTFGPSAMARRPSPPGYRSLASAVNQSSGYWIWERRHQAVINPDTRLRCPSAIDAYRLEYLSNRFERQFRHASCVYADATGRMLSLSRQPAESTGDAYACDGSVRVAALPSALVTCLTRGEMETSVVADASRSPTEVELQFVAGIIEISGNH